MQYEIRIWKDPDKMPDIEPQKAAGRLQAMLDSTVGQVEKMAKAARGAGIDGDAANPDILIDKNGGGDDVIQSVSVSYITKEVVTEKLTQEKSKSLGALGRIMGRPASLQGNMSMSVQSKNISKVRVIKIDIKGNLYLPLKEDDIMGNAKSMVGLATDENKIRDTLLLSQWASVRPEDDKEEHFYRGIVVSVLTKAGDFRVITAKKVYVDSYTEDYTEGEFGTFELSLIEKVDSNEAFKVKGLGHEEIPLIKSIGDKLEKAAKVVAGVGAAVAAVGAVGKTVTETVEKFTGETAATRWVKYGFDTASSAGNVANSASNVMKNPKDVKTWTDEINNVNKNVNERIQKGVDTKEAIPLAQMEKMYLAIIQKDPDKYKKYLEASDEEKYDLLKEASKKSRDRSAITKEMEEQERDYYKDENAKKQIADMEKKYLPLIQADPALADKYAKADTMTQLDMLKKAKYFDDMQNTYLPLIKLDPATEKNYNKGDTAAKLEMLEKSKKEFNALENKYKENIVGDPPKMKEKDYNNLSIDQKYQKLKEEKKKDPSSNDNNPPTPPANSSANHATENLFSSTDLNSLISSAANKKTHGDS
ncbi:MAG: hypothetical protein IKZ58_05355 [Selenomonadaceae bacterium]|nr:hypothetical protein [Selenomonadaceae bacterium]